MATGFGEAKSQLKLGKYIKPQRHSIRLDEKMPMEVRTRVAEVSASYGRSFGRRLSYPARRCRNDADPGHHDLRTGSGDGHDPPQRRRRQGLWCSRDRM